MADLVQLLNENGFLANGEAYSSVFVSQSLNRRDLGRIYTLPHVELLYSASAVTTAKVSASGDGGATFITPLDVELEATTGDEVRRVSALMRVTGWDLRLKIEFDQTLISHIHVFIPPLIERGKHHNAVRSTELS